jgi:predicted TIM-barrel fold metal-dependent hydrolase
MKGLKLHPWLQSFSLSHPAVEPILRRAGELGMPVLFHDGTPPYSTPLQIASVAERVPGTPVILGHSGLDDLWEDAILAARRHRNIFLCLCSLSAGAIREIIRRVPPERLLFGSDSGFGPGLGKAAIAKIRGAGASVRTRKLIFSGNAMRLLKNESGK